MRKRKDDGVILGLYLGHFGAVWMFSRPEAETTDQVVSARLP